MSVIGSPVVGLDLSSHIFDRVPTFEFERRWRAVSSAMAEEGIDVLVMQNVGDGIGGYTRWFTDAQALRGYPIAVVFEREAPMTVIMHGPHGDTRRLPPGGLPGFRGVGEIRTEWSFTSAAYTGRYAADRVLEVLAPYRTATVGLVGVAQMSGAFALAVRDGLPRATLRDASDLVDAIKVVKSAEELAGIELCAQIQEQVLEAMLVAAVPGATDFDCLLAGDLRSRELGSNQAVLAFGSAPPGTPPPLAPTRASQRVLEKGDRIVTLVETNGPGGWYTELGRMAVLGSADAQLREEAALAAELQDETVHLLRPGAKAAEVFSKYESLLATRGLPAEVRVHCHGQGYDLVERPLIRSDETMTLALGMNLAVHPQWQRNGVTGWMCDNFVIRPDGTHRLHRLPREVIEV